MYDKMRQLTTQDIAGSWFPTGYHGHSRSRSRSDFITEYRYLAKPQPPLRFLQRSRQNPALHVFSHHDNKNSNSTDGVSYFQSGLGRRRLKQGDQLSKPDLITWIPTKADLTAEPYSPAVSVYRQAYSNQTIRPMTQMIVQRPKTSFDEDNQFQTMYRYSYGTQGPNSEALTYLATTINQSSKRPPTGAIQQRRLRTFRSALETVADCLHWQVDQINHEKEADESIQSTKLATGRGRRLTVPRTEISLPDGSEIPCQHLEQFPFLRDIPSDKHFYGERRPRPTYDASVRSEWGDKARQTAYANALVNQSTIADTGTATVPFTPVPHVASAQATFSHSSANNAEEAMRTASSTSTRPPTNNCSDKIPVLYSHTPAASRATSYRQLSEKRTKSVNDLTALEPPVIDTDPIANKNSSNYEATTFRAADET